MGLSKALGAILSFVGLAGVWKATNAGGIRFTVPLPLDAASIPTQGTQTVANTAISYDVDTLARTMWGEARSEGAKGMQAVANVVMTRVRDRRWPNSVAGVCLEYKQFSCWNAGDPNRAKALAVTTGDSNFRRALELAQAAVDGYLPDITGGANHYQVRGTDAYWSRGVSPVAVIGIHQFYNLA